MAVEQNLGLTVERFSPAIAGTAVLRAQAIYNPTLSLLGDFRGADFRIFPNAPGVERNRFFDANSYNFV